MKYDYAKLLNTFTTKEFQMYSMLSQNEDYVAEKIYEACKYDVAGCANLFLNTGDKFKQWLCFYGPENQGFSYFDTELIGHIKRNGKWAEDYYGIIGDYEAATKYLIASWSNKTKTLKANMSKLEMIYQRYTRFIMSPAGQDFAFAKSLDSFTDDIAMEEGAYYNDRPFYDDPVYKLVQLNKFKKFLILKYCKTPYQCLEMQTIWDMVFHGNGKLNYKEAERIIWKEISKEEFPHATLYLHLKKMTTVLLKEVLAHVDEYFNTDATYEIDGKVYTIKTALEKYLTDAKMEYFIESLQHRSRTSNVAIVDYVTKWADARGLISSTYSSNPNVLVQVKGDSYGITHKGWKLYFYKGGGFKDFFNKITGFYEDLV